MFETLVTWIKGAFSWIWDGFKTLFTKIFEWGHTVWGIMILVVSWVAWVFEQIKEGVVVVGGLVGALAYPSGPPATGGIGYYMSVCNTFLPLSELFAFCVGWVALVAALSSYRFIKSWIPWGS